MAADILRNDQGSHQAAVPRQQPVHVPAGAEPVHGRGVLLTVSQLPHVLQRPRKRDQAVCSVHER